MNDINVLRETGIKHDQWLRALNIVHNYTFQKEMEPDIKKCGAQVERE